MKISVNIFLHMVWLWVNQVISIFYDPPYEEGANFGSGGLCIYTQLYTINSSKIGPPSPAGGGGKKKICEKIFFSTLL